MIEFNSIILRITINYMMRYFISYEDIFIILQALFLSIILLRAFSEILLYIPYDILWYHIDCKNNKNKGGGAFITA